MYRRAVLRRGAIAGSSLAALPGVSGSAAAQSESFEPAGRVAIDGAAEAVVGDDGSVAYLAATDGFAIVDIDDPAEPNVLVEEREIDVDGQPLTEILDVKVDGDRLAVAGPGNANTDVFEGFVIYDVSDPADPVEHAVYETGYHIHNCFLDGEILYVVANGDDSHPELPESNTLVVYDVSDEATEIGRWSQLVHEPEWAEIDWQVRYLHDVYVHDDVAYLAHWNAGTYLLDVSDPAEPTYLSHVRDTDLEEQRSIDNDEIARLGLPGNDHYSAVDDTGTLLAVGREAWETGGDDPDGPGGIDLYDVGDESEPTQLASIAAPEADDASYGGGEWTTAHNFELRDDRLYASWYQGGVSVHDVSEPADPVELDWWEDRDTAGFWTARVATPGETIVASSTDLIPAATTEGALYTFPIGLDAESAGDDSIPEFAAPAGLAGVAGGLLGLEWLRRRRDEQ